MTRDELKAKILKGIDTILGLPWPLSKKIDVEQRRILECQRDMYETAEEGDAAIDYLVAALRLNETISRLAKKRKLKIVKKRKGKTK